ncbi:Cytochrome bc1 complex cytochrome b subunit [Streptomyces sp. RB5]|uniref:Cytochrome bc1 complex cytochrome b subunit n=1 Tax=Streptomyces smaragdinus TaxID=2585196 RepID=A0A7K0CLC2_9ACTN|nr:ubiquinol-cytochrome c reductase cytochrome b subunit [Streptomyces smaragdinus]MQY13554.1 Cytochrome bc1 complex cytochrome b subunit [Streptomyces smaragdinus]
MSVQEKTTPPGPGSGERIAGWARARLGPGGTAASRILRGAVPQHWSFLLGQIALYSFVVVLLTGVYLSLYFDPSMVPVQYDGSYAPLRGQWVSAAFDSTLHISFEVRGGLLIRQAHHWAALVMEAALLAHLMRLFFTGAFRKPRELTWLIWFSLLVVGMFAGLTGYDLPDDLLSGTGLSVVYGTLLSVPFVGTYIALFLFGGEFPGDDIVARFNVVHVLVIPAVMVALFGAHLFLVLRHRHTQFPGSGRTGRNVVGLPLRVHLVKSAGYFFVVAGVILLIAGTTQINPVWLYGPYRPDQVSAGSQPDWYMGVADGLLRVMPGWEVTAWGHTLALDNLIPLTAGMLFFVVLGLYPYLEAWLTDDDHEQHLLDRPRNRPVRTALGVAWLSFYAVALTGGANDILATRFHVSVNAITWGVRIALFAVPVLAFVITKRWALGLQYRDRDEVLHGRETGVIKRLPDGGFVEVHEPLGPDRLHVLTAHEQYAPVPDPEPERHGPLRRLRTGLSRRLYGTDAQVAKPTERQYLESSGRH